MWPYVCQFVEKVFKETIEPAIKEVSSHLSTFSFSNIDLGDKVRYAHKCLKVSQSLCIFYTLWRYLYQDNVVKKIIRINIA